MIDDSKIIDVGYDFNKDKHCDLDGWFVNKEGNHKPLIRERTNYIDEKIKNPSYQPKELLTHFNAFGDYYGYKLSSLNEYSKNDDNLEFSSPNINKVLRNDGINSKEMSEKINELDELISHFAIKDEVTVYRGIKISDNLPIELLRLKQNDTYFDKAFLSTSYSMAHAVGYASSGKYGIIVMQIKLKRGTNAIPILESVAGHENEYEILVKRSQEFVVKKVMGTIVGTNKCLIYYEMETI